MRDQLTFEEQLAIDSAGGPPPRVKDPASGEVSVLLRSADFDSVRALLADEPDVLRLCDPRTKQQYALVPEDRYQRFKSLFEQVPNANGLGLSDGNGARLKPAEYPPELLEWARQRFDEAEFMAGIQEIRETGGLKLDDFIGELQEIVAAHE